MKSTDKQSGDSNRDRNEKNKDLESSRKPSGEFQGSTGSISGNGETGLGSNRDRDVEGSRSQSDRTSEKSDREL